jgi:hypothetical protein
MKTEQQIRAELALVRKAHKRMCDNDDDDAGELAMFGAQQALGWVLGELMAPSDIDAALTELSQQQGAINRSPP